jgi:hypothetical protein
MKLRPAGWASGIRMFHIIKLYFACRNIMLPLMTLPELGW